MQALLLLSTGELLQDRIFNPLYLAPLDSIFFFFHFRAGSQHVTQADPKLKILLPVPPKYWD